MPLIHTWQDVENLGGITPAERKLIAACKTGEPCVLGDGSLPPKGPPDPSREIRANVLRYLILGGCDKVPVRGPGLQLTGGHITGALDLSFACARGVTFLCFCRFDQAVTVQQTRFKILNLNNSFFPALNAQGAQIIGGVLLNDITAEGEVNLLGAKIDGQVTCVGATFSATTEDALKAEGAQITGSVFLNDINATGEVRLSGTKIGGTLSCERATFTATSGYALNTEGAQIANSVFLDCITTKGEIRLTGAKIEGVLSCKSATFAAISGRALNIEGAQITDSVFLSRITAEGEVCLSGAEIGGQLSCNGATFAATSGHALNAQSLQVTGDVLLLGIVATGEVSLSGAEIGGQLSCVGATFKATTGPALNAQRLRVRDGLFWRNVDTPCGLINFNSAHIGDLVDDVESWPKKGGLHLNGFTYARISGTATAIDTQTRIDWLENGSVWDGEFLPQPFTHLAKVLRGMGHELDAQKVLVKRDQLLGKFSRRRSWKSAGNLKKAGLLAPLLLRIIFDWLYHYFAGYGHRPIFSFGWLIGLILTAGVFAHLAYDEGSFAPNSGPVLVSQDWKDFADLPDNPARLWSAKGAPGQDWETFCAGAWAADLVIPIVDLGQSDAWSPSTARGPWGRFLWRAQWVFILMGWVVTALGAAALTGVIRRE